MFDLQFKLVALALLLVQAGCASWSNVALSPEAKSSIQQAYVSSRVVMPENVFYSGPAEAIGFGVGGFVGAAIAGGGDDSKTVMTEMMKQLGLDQIVADAFRDELEARDQIALADMADQANAVFSFEVEIYGLGQTQGFSSTLYPTLGFHVILVDDAGETIWRKYAAVAPLNSENSLGHKPREYAADPELLRATFRNAAGIVSRKLLKDF